MSLSKKLCVFGCFIDNELYSRNRVLITALSAVFGETFEVRPHRTSSRVYEHGSKLSLKRLLQFLGHFVLNFSSLARQARIVRSADAVYIPYPAYLDFIFLKLILLGRHKPMVLIDAFLCLHDTLINDRKIFAPQSLPARLVSWLEARVLSGADMIFIDTCQQKDILLESYGLSPERVVVTPVGIDEAVWTPLPPLPLIGQFRVLFWGTFIPLHGIETIVAAAQILEKKHPGIQIKLVGDGQTGDAVERQIDSLGLGNIAWERALVSSLELRAETEKCHCILGVFGNSAKAGNVIPYKVYQAMASNKIVISREAPALSHMYQSQGDRSGLIFVPPADPQALASAIANLSKTYNTIYHDTVARELYDTFLSNAVLQSRVKAGFQSTST